MNELLTNSFKHAFGSRDRGVITVECVRHGEDRYRVVIADDGVGLPEGGVWPVRERSARLSSRLLEKAQKRTSTSKPRRAGAFG